MELDPLISLADNEGLKKTAGKGRVSIYTAAAKGEIELITIGRRTFLKTSEALRYRDAKAKRFVSRMNVPADRSGGADMARYTSRSKLARMSSGNAQATLEADYKLCLSIIEALADGSAFTTDGRSVNQHLAAERCALRGIMERAEAFGCYVGEVIR